jgi:hypothetical protein
MSSGVRVPWRTGTGLALMAAAVVAVLGAVPLAGAAGGDLDPSFGEAGKVVTPAGWLAFLRIGRDIYAVGARTGTRRLLARAGATPIGLSMAGRRVAWAENRGGRAYVRAVTLGPGG